MDNHAPSIGSTLTSRVSFLVKDSVVYGIGAIAARLCSLVTFPILARHFSVSEYGIIDFYLVLSAFLVLLFVFGQDNAVARFFYYYDDVSDRRELISQSLFLQITVLIIFLPVLWVFAPEMDGLLPSRNNDDFLYHLILAQVPFMLLINFSQNILKWTYKRSQFLALTLGFIIVQTILLSIGVLVYDFDIRQVMTVYLTTNVFAGCLGLFFVRSWIVVPNSVKYIRQMLPFAVPFGIMAALGAFLPTAQRMMVSGSIGNEELGLFATAIKISVLLSIPVMAFQTAWGPFSLSQHREPEIDKTFGLILRAFAYFTCVGALVLSALADTIIGLLASDRYIGAAPLVYPLAAAMAVQAISWITEIGISISKKSYFGLYAYIFYGIILIGATSMLAPILGLVGVALASLLAQIIRAILGSYFAQLAYPINWPYKHTILYSGSSMVLALIALQAHHFFPTLSLATLHGSAASLCLLIGWTFLFSRDERRSFLVILKSYLNKRSMAC